MMKSDKKIPYKLRLKMSYKNLFLKKLNFATLLFSILTLSASTALFAQYVDPPAAPKIVGEAVDPTSDVKPEVAPADPGMQIPVDGSSLEAFEASLAKIKESATEANYITLDGAIDYLLVYDIGAGRDKAKLAKNLDGKTGEQILNEVDWRNKR